jgi:DNA-binding response OmpR family regulator
VAAVGSEEMVGQLRNADVNLMILDLRLGQGDGVDLLRDVHEVVFDCSIDAQVLRLRRKLERDPSALLRAALVTHKSKQA